MTLFSSPWASDGYAVWRPFPGAPPETIPANLLNKCVELAFFDAGDLSEWHPATLQGERIIWDGGSRPAPHRHLAILKAGTLEVELAPAFAHSRRVPGGVFRIRVKSGEETIAIVMNCLPDPGDPDYV